MLKLGALNWNVLVTNWKLSKTVWPGGSVGVDVPALNSAVNAETLLTRVTRCRSVKVALSGLVSNMMAFASGSCLKRM